MLSFTLYSDRYTLFIIWLLLFDLSLLGMPSLPLPCSSSLFSTVGRSTHSSTRIQSKHQVLYYFLYDPLNWKNWPSSPFCYSNVNTRHMTSLFMHQSIGNCTLLGGIFGTKSWISDMSTENLHTPAKYLNWLKSCLANAHDELLWCVGCRHRPYKLNLLVYCFSSSKTP